MGLLLALQALLPLHGDSPITNLSSFFGPKFEDVRRTNFERSKSFRTGAVQELENMRFEYIKAAPEHKKALADIIRHRAIEIPIDAMPADLSAFVNTLSN